MSEYYKIICTPPKRFCEEEVVYKADKYSKAENIAAWYVNVEWENYSAYAQIVPITKEEWTTIPG